MLHLVLYTLICNGKMNLYSVALLFIYYYYYYYHNHYTRRLQKQRNC